MIASLDPPNFGYRTVNVRVTILAFELDTDARLNNILPHIFPKRASSLHVITLEISPELIGTTSSTSKSVASEPIPTSLNTLA